MHSLRVTERLKILNCQHEVNLTLTQSSPRGVAAYMERTRNTAREAGYVETVFGRRLWLPNIRSGVQGGRQGAERAAINAPMRGTAADLMKLAMIAVQGWLEHEKLATRW